jgi:hypothetical protein
MGFIKEPEGVDFIINSKPLTDKERQGISLYIKEYKTKNRYIKKMNIFVRFLHQLSIKNE